MRTFAVDHTKPCARCGTKNKTRIGACLTCIRLKSVAAAAARDGLSERTCTKCQRTLPIVSFTRYKTHWRSQCNPCRSESERMRRVADPESARAKQRAKRARRADHCRAVEKKYKIDHAGIIAKARRNRGLARYCGMTFGQYMEMYKRQDGCCAICRVAMTWHGRKPTSACVDHCHTTGLVRGLLCRLCNTGLGGFRDSRAFLFAAMRYLSGG